MLVVAINTASTQVAGKSSIALIEKDPNPAVGASATGKVLGEESWISNRNESERVLPGLARLLTENGKSWEDVEGVFVVKGPGSYTSLRVGITIANAIAWTRKIPLWATDLSVFEKNQSKTFGEILISLKLSDLEKKNQVTPLYAAPPKITPRKR